jgi:hypothetical protein
MDVPGSGSIVNTIDASATGAGGLGVGAGLSPDLLQAIKTTEAKTKKIRPFFIL